jgi:hypothetical protein
MDITLKKANEIDSKVIAQFALDERILHSIFPKTQTVQKKANLKNEIHSILRPKMFNLNYVLTYIIGKKVSQLLPSIALGATVDYILEILCPNIREEVFR